MSSLRSHSLPLAAALALALVPQAANARGKSVLEGNPDVIKNKFEYRKQRIEIAPTFEATISAEFQHTISGGLKVEYHLTDTISFGAIGLFGAAFNTGLYGEIRDSLPPTSTTSNPTPSQDEADDHLNTLPVHGGILATFTPWGGKMALFGKAYIHYDIYIQGGLALAQTKNSFGGNDEATTCDEPNPGVTMICSDGDGSNDRFTDPRNDGPHNAGLNPGILVGGGLHIFLAKWMALDLAVRSYMFNDNPSGFDFNGDLRVDGEDPRFMSHLFVGVGLALYFPKIKISK